ncbi:TetR/AcrR family transcriptional regulator [Leifsonia sp. A12D58]|uniref:TetR/AcrR family transcriptional regulator n=1 Tax=Leifsonia sp. A12D58 TaxID=3397674 RepID=UPI0039E0E831
MTSSDKPQNEASHPRRRDARQNRERLLAEARELFATNGVDASLEEVARRSGVGVATLYRNFPTRDDLIRALYDLALAELLTAKDEILAAPTAWDGIVIFMERTSEWLVADPSLPSILQRMAAIDPSYRPSAALEGTIASLVKQAISDGDLRPGIDGVDLAVLTTMVGSLGRAGSDFAGQWRRQLAIAIDGLRAVDSKRPKLPGRPRKVDDSSAHGLSRRARRGSENDSGTAAKTADSAKSAATDKPADTGKRADTGKSADTGKPGESRKPGDSAKSGDSSKAGDSKK